MKDLIPFIISYIFFTVFFCMLYASMGVELESEINAPDGGSEEVLGYFG
jgi:hypothetical protein